MFQCVLVVFTLTERTIPASRVVLNVLLVTVLLQTLVFLVLSVIIYSVKVVFLFVRKNFTPAVRFVKTVT